jgi:hypothetical protein
MRKLTCLFFRMFFKLFLSRKHLVFKITVLEKENEILKRRQMGKRIFTFLQIKAFLAVATS